MDLREGLENAVGVSEYAIILYADIRGFSDFSDDDESRTLRPTSAKCSST
jgi:hypothetical protein